MSIPLLVTPDYGLSDIWHFNYPLKHLLSESLRSGKFPLWTDLVGNGFPIAAEGQIGAFSPVNWIIFGLFPMPQAFMIAIFSCFLISAVGSYLFSRVLGFTRSVSLAASAFASVSGYAIVQMTHLNLLQSFSFVPWAVFFLERFLTSQRRTSFLWLSMIFAQMILVGYSQTVFNTVAMLMVYAVVKGGRHRWASIAGIGSAAIFSLFLTAVQVIPLLEFVGESDTLGAASRQRFIHPLSLKHLLTIINPFAFGDPSRGTYPMYGNDWGMFWENLLYVGVIPLVLLLLALWSRSARRMFIQKPTIAIVAVFVASLLLSLGKYTPLSIVSKIPPFSFTRIASRFLVFTNWSFGFLGVVALVGIIGSVRRVRIRKILPIFLGVIHVIQVGWMFRSYHLWVDSQKWLDPPKTAGVLPDNARILSIFQSDRWNKTFLTDGWVGKEDVYRENRQSLDPNSNLLFNVKNVGVYAQQYPTRQEMIQRNIADGGVLGEHLRSVYGVTHIVDVSVAEFQIFTLSFAVPEISIPPIITKVRDKDEALGRMAQESFQPGVEALWESERIPDNDEQIVVVNRSFYPGWMAYLGDRKIPIYPVNINQQAVIVPKDAVLLSLRFIFDPWSYKIGGIVSLVSVGLWIVLMRRFRYNSVHAYRD